MLDIYSVYIDGTAHCANMAASKDSDPVALKQARKVSSFMIWGFSLAIFLRLNLNIFKYS